MTTHQLPAMEIGFDLHATLGFVPPLVVVAIHRGTHHEAILRQTPPNGRAARRFGFARYNPELTLKFATHDAANEVIQDLESMHGNEWSFRADSAVSKEGKVQ